jgi:hypothetical protein
LIPPFLFSAFLTLPEPSCLAFNGLPLPRIHLHWVDILQGRNFLNYFVTAQRLKRRSRPKLV